MWLDNASNIDLLFYSPYADTIVDFTKNPALSPMTIGLYGSWGAGKSSLLKLIEDRLDKIENNVCISLNAWQFEDYEDAKVAIMESLLKSLEENRSFFESAGEKIKGLLKRVDYFKIGKDLLLKGAPYAVGAITGNPIPIAVNLAGNLSNVGEMVTQVQSFSKEYLKSAEETVNENVRKFREEFEEMLGSVESIKNIVVIVDDLDRCSPERIIDTLEAIKLFLSVKKTTFIIAVDQRIIEYAVKTKYPQIEEFDISSDYIEKIVQLPIRIPELSSKDIENYLSLLICQLHLTEESFSQIIATLNEEKTLLQDTPITYALMETTIAKKNGKYANGSSEEVLRKDIETISEIGHVVSGSLKGNPRQAKRFMNTFFVRKNLAKLYFGEEIQLSILAKLLALETIDFRAFKRLYEWSSNFDGRIADLAVIEQKISAGEELNEEYSLWSNPRIVRWLKSKPELHDQDLSKYFYLSRDTLSSAESMDALFNEAERKMLASIKACIGGQEDSRIEELKKMESESQIKICDAILAHFKSDNIGLNIISRIYVAYKDRQSEIVEYLKGKPKEYFAVSAIPHLARMYKANPTQIATCLGHLLEQKKILDKFKEQVEGDSFSVKAVKRG